MKTFAKYKGILFSADFSGNNTATIYTADPKIAQKYGFKSAYYEKKVLHYSLQISYESLDEFYTLETRAVYKGHDFNIETQKENKFLFRATIPTKPQQKELEELGFTGGWEDWIKWVDISECDRVYEVRKDIIPPKHVLSSENQPEQEPDKGIDLSM
jgi:hypothetical protein